MKVTELFTKRLTKPPYFHLILIITGSGEVLCFPQNQFTNPEPSSWWTLNHPTLKKLLLIGGSPNPELSPWSKVPRGFCGWFETLEPWLTFYSLEKWEIKVIGNLSQDNNKDLRQCLGRLYLRDNTDVNIYVTHSLIPNPFRGLPPSRGT